ncbi:MAG TPA: hypothetical protein GX747_02620, partial [Tenericutes bacterium]|nr:hypothetical protein [Mycoplasmatota bacterium]
KIIYNSDTITKTIPVKIEYVEETDNIAENENILVYKNCSKTSVDIDVKNNISFLSMPEDNLFFPDIVYLAIGMIANKLQKEQKYFIQSSVVKNEKGNSIMFLGDPNSGKTTLASKLILTGNWSLVSNDNVIVKLEKDKLVTIAGTKSVQMRYGAIKLFFPQLLDKINTPKEIDTRDEWDIKIYVNDIFKEIGVKYSDESVVSDIYIINTVKNGDIFIREREAIDRNLLIYEHLTKQIRSNRYALTSFDRPMPSFEQEEYMQARYDMAKIISNSINIYETKGSVDNIIENIKAKNGR